MAPSASSTTSTSTLASQQRSTYYDGYRLQFRPAGATGVCTVNNPGEPPAQLPTFDDTLGTPMSRKFELSNISDWLFPPNESEAAHDDFGAMNDLNVAYELPELMNLNLPYLEEVDVHETESLVYVIGHGKGY